MLKNKTCIAKFNEYSYIFRQDTHNYTEEDILAEIREWEDILVDKLHFVSSYHIIKAIISNRLTSTLACTGRNSFDRSTGYVKVSSQFMKYHDDPDKFHSTLCHETIHSLNGCFNHGETFKAVGKVVMNIYENLQVSRTIGDSGYNAYRRQQTADRVNWHVICQGCGQTIKRQRACDFTKNPQRYKCGICGGKFETFKLQDDGPMIKYITMSI